MISGPVYKTLEPIRWRISSTSPEAIWTPCSLCDIVTNIPIEIVHHFKENEKHDQNLM
jgi:hypothetical protein